MDFCDFLDRKIKTAINNSNNFIQYTKAVALCSYFKPDLLKCQKLNSFLFNDCDDKDLFVTSFLSKKDCGIIDLSSDRCICERFLYISVFSSSCYSPDLAEIFFQTFKNLNGENKHDLQ